MRILPSIAELLSATTDPTDLARIGAPGMTESCEIHRFPSLPQLALCAGGPGDESDQRPAADERRVIPYPRRTPRRVRVGLGMVIALGLWALVLLSGYALIRGIGRIFDGP